VRLSSSGKETEQGSALSPARVAMDDTRVATRDTGAQLHSPLDLRLSPALGRRDRDAIPDTITISQSASATRERL
jgi:hypothetical protein